MFDDDDFFDEMEEEGLDEEQSSESVVDEIYDSQNTSSVGSVVFYDPVAFTFMTAASDGSSLINAHFIKDWRTIMLGTVINEYEDKTIDVLMCGFLMAEPLLLPHMYIFDEKQKYIPAYANGMFKRFVSAFFKKVPAYNDLLKLNITMPTVTDMITIQERFPDIFDAMRVSSVDLQKYTEYINRLRSNYIYATHKGRMYIVRINTENKDEKPDVKNPEFSYDADFLCVFRHITPNKLSEEYQKLDTEHEKFFNRTPSSDDEQSDEQQQ